MVIKNEAQLKQILLAKCKNAVIKAQEQIYQIIHRFIKAFYVEDDFSPEMYERTYQLLSSLVKSEIISTGNGYQARVYFDVDKLDHYRHTIKSHGKKYTYEGKHKWGEQQILDTALTGGLPHGGHAGGTQIWYEALSQLNAEAINTLKRMLISEGIPIK